MTSEPTRAKLETLPARHDSLAIPIGNILSLGAQAARVSKMLVRHLVAIVNLGQTLSFVGDIAHIDSAYRKV